MRPAIWSGGRPVYCQTTPITGIPISGKMSVGVRSAASGPIISRSSASTTNVYGRLSAILASAIINQAFPEPARGAGIGIAAGQFVRADLPEPAPKSQRPRTSPAFTSAALDFHSPPQWRRSIEAGRSAHQFEGIGKEIRAAKIARFQGKQHVALAGADGTQHRHAGGDLRTDQKTGNLQPIDHRAGGFAAGVPVL